VSRPVFNHDSPIANDEVGGILTQEISRDMGSIVVRVGNALRQPLDDQMDVSVVSTRTDTTVGAAANVAGKTAVRFEGLNEGQPYVIKVFPMRHRPVAQFALPGPDDNPAVVHLYTPLHPERVRVALFPAYEKLASELQRVLACSQVEGIDAQGDALYGALTNLQKAGLFNLFGKMSSFGFDEHRTVWSFVDSIVRVRADRVFVDVQPALRDLVKTAVATDRFHEAPSALHTPPLGFLHAGSFKTAEQYGNLQLTFFASAQPPLAFRVDADIDDAAGLGHAFQVIRNWVTKGTTHPYDIHQILAFRQEVFLPYELA
jgi:hypothetical protein